MHEASIAQGVLDTVLAALPEKGGRITRITMVAGVFSGVVKECLEMYLSELSKGTAAAGAALELRRATATLTCSACGKSEPYDNNGDMHLRCVKCGGANRLDGGNELYVDSIEVNT